MVKFKVENKKTLKEFLELCTMEGKVEFAGGSAIKKPLFESFFLHAKKAVDKEKLKDLQEKKEISPQEISILKNDRLEVLTLDTYRYKTTANFILYDVEVLEEGMLPITDYEIIDDVLGQRGLKKDNPVLVYDEGSLTYIENENGKHRYKVAQKGNIAKKIKKSKIKQMLEMWKNNIKFNNEGVLQFHHPKLEDPIPFPTRVNIKKDDFMDIVDDVIKVTEDSEVRLEMTKDGLYAFSGKANANINSRHLIDIESKLDTFLEFNEEFYLIQTMIPHLFDNIDISARRVKENNTIVLYIVSKDTKKKIIAKLGTPSIAE